MESESVRLRIASGLVEVLAPAKKVFRTEQGSEVEVNVLHAQRLTSGFCVMPFTTYLYDLLRRPTYTTYLESVIKNRKNFNFFAFPVLIQSFQRQKRI